MIDFKKYNNPEIAGHIIDIMTVPSVAAKKIVKYLVIFTLLGIVACTFLGSLSHQGIFITALSIVVTFIITVISGLLFGAFAFTTSMNSSIRFILDYINNIVKLIISDVRQVIENGVSKVGDAIKSKVDEISLPSGHEIVSGVVIDIINPTVKVCLKKKIPFVGGIAFYIYSLMAKILLKLSKVFFNEVDKQIKNTLKNKIEYLPTNVDSNKLVIAINEKWTPMIESGVEEYTKIAKSYLKRMYLLIALPLISFGIITAIIPISLIILISR